MKTPVKKGAKKGKPSLKTPKEFLDSDGLLCLQGETFWKYKALDNEVTRINAELLHVNRQIQDFVDKHQEFKDLLEKKQSLMNSNSVAVQELVEFNTTLQEKLKRADVDLTKCSIDEKTGRIHIHPSPEPVKVSTKNGMKKTSHLGETGSSSKEMRNGTS